MAYEQVECEECKGTGKSPEEPYGCPSCYGNGYTDRTILIGRVGSETPLRSRMSTAKITASEFDYLKQHPTECPPELKIKFDNLIQRKKRSNAAKREVITRNRNRKK